MTNLPRTVIPGRCLWLLLVLLPLALPLLAEAGQANRLRRIKITPHPTFTSIKLFFQDPPEYTVSLVPGKVRLTVRGADAPAFKRFRSYADARIAGVFCSMRDAALRIDVPVRDAQPGVQALSPGNPNVLTLDIGPGVRRVQQADIAPGREAILNGTERFVREYGVPARAGLPFVPTDVKVLKRFLNEDETKLFQQGEGLLYKEHGAEALQVFSAFLGKEPAVRALALYRIAGSLCLLERSEEALKAFKEAQALSPGYLDRAPELLQSYAEVLAKSGDFAGGRAMLIRLLKQLAGTGYEAPLLNRLADMTERHGEGALALSIYRNVAVHAPGTPAASRARMKIADREMFTLSRDRYRELLRRYQSIYESPGDFALRDEALFKVALLQALYGPAHEALDATIVYDRRYPRGIFSTIVKKAREELLPPVYREIYAAKDQAALAQLALDNREYLAVCFGDPEFAPRLARAFRETARLTDEVALFGYLAERTWAAAAAPFLLARVTEDGLAIGNLPAAESAARGFLARFPGDPRGQRVREQLGRIAFERGDLKTVAAELGFLNGKGQKSEFAESDYYLGKALSGAGDFREAERALLRYTAAAKPGAQLLADGYFAVGAARSALREYPGALAAYQQGAKLATGEMADQFLYKMGEAYLQMKMVREATEAWEKVAGHGNGTWAKLASESLNDLRWRLKVSGGLP